MQATETENKKTKKLQRGITLIELLVALTILAFISAVVVVNILPERDKAAVRTAGVDIRQIEAALDQYRLDMGSYPSTEQGLRALLEVPATARLKDRYRPGGYLRDFPTDPWGSPYQYRFEPGEGRVEIYSFGADGEQGGEGLNADISNRAPRNSRAGSIALQCSGAPQSSGAKGAIRFGGKIIRARPVVDRASCGPPCVVAGGLRRDFKRAAPCLRCGNRSGTVRGAFAHR